jgi:hypothetical protein
VDQSFVRVPIIPEPAVRNQTSSDMVDAPRPHLGVAGGLGIQVALGQHDRPGAHRLLQRRSRHERVHEIAIKGGRGFAQRVELYPALIRAVRDQARIGERAT